MIASLTKPLAHSLLAALVLVAGAAPSAPPTPATPVLKATPDPAFRAQAPADDVPANIEVKLECPTPVVSSGGFAVVVTAPSDATLRWSNQFPEGAGAPLELQDTSGRKVLVFMQPSAGKYQFQLSAQIPSDGLDPFAEASLLVTVGKDDSQDDTDDDRPAPKPDLSGVSKTAYESVATYGLLLGKLHEEAATLVLDKKITGRTAFDKYMEKSLAARTAAFQPLMESAESNLPAGDDWREADLNQAATWLREAAAGFKAK